MSADFAHQFVSKLISSTSVMLVTEPLLLLCEIGILRKLRPAVLAHVKTSAVNRPAIFAARLVGVGLYSDTGIYAVRPAVHSPATPIRLSP